MGVVPHSCEARADGRGLDAEGRRIFLRNSALVLRVQRVTRSSEARRGRRAFQTQ